MNKASKEIILGTANLGQKYGITNNRLFNPSDSLSILNYAITRGIRHFDTAPDYGSAHSLLSNILVDNNDLKITTKISSKLIGKTEKILDHFSQSLSDLNIDSVDTVLFHSSDFVSTDNFKEIVTALLETKKIKNIGVSIYEKSEIANVLETGAEINTFQVPENILDQRLVNDREMFTYRSQGISFIVRSVFLQGLLLSDLKNIPKSFLHAMDKIQIISSLAEKNKVSKVDICMSYAFDIGWADKVLIASASINQLEEILNFRKINVAFDQIPRLPLELIDPRKWPNQ